MDIPKTVRIGAFDFTVGMIDGAENFERKHGVRALGLCNFKDQHIDIRSDMPTAKRAEVLLHEIMHAISDNGSQRALLNDDALDEAVVNSTANAVLALIRDNPGLFSKIESALTTKAIKIDKRNSARAHRGAQPAASR